MESEQGQILQKIEIPLNLSATSFSAFAKFDVGSELTRLLRFIDSMLVVVVDGGEVQAPQAPKSARRAWALIIGSLIRCAR